MNAFTRFDVHFFTHERLEKTNLKPIIILREAKMVLNKEKGGLQRVIGHPIIGLTFYICSR